LFSLSYFLDENKSSEEPPQNRDEGVERAVVSREAEGIRMWPTGYPFVDLRRGGRGGLQKWVGLVMGGG
jgi:hypothetical protein